MLEKFKDATLNNENVIAFFDDLYEKSLEGIPHVSKPVKEIASDYLDKNPSKEEAAKEMLKNQIIKCTTSGVVTGFGGALTLPVTLPANVTSVLYIQMRMIACAAEIGGYTLDDDQTRTLIYACLVGASVNEVFKKFGVDFAEKMAIAGVKKIPGKALIEINKRLGFRFITKFGETGLVNLGKLIPGLGAIVNGSFDLVSTKFVANRAYNMFIERKFDAESNKIDAEDVIDIDFSEIDED